MPDAKVLLFEKPATTAELFQKVVENHLEEGESFLPLLSHKCLAVIYSKNDHRIVWLEEAWQTDDFVNKMSEQFCKGIKCFRFQGHAAENEGFADFILRHFPRAEKKNSACS